MKEEEEGGRCRGLVADDVVARWEDEVKGDKEQAKSGGGGL